MEHLLYEIGLVVVASSLIGVFGFYLKQPLILAYIIAGILIGPFGFNLISNNDFIHGIASVGIMLMLFLVGLEMNTSRLKELGLVSLVAGIGQVVFTGSIGFLLIKLFGFSSVQSAYLAVALTFSSTVIAVKLLADKKDTSSLYGQICIGILIVQDVLAIVSLLLLAGFQEGTAGFDVINFGVLILKGAIIGYLTILVSKKILKYLYNKIATSHELLILFSLSWCFIISIISMQIGFSMEIGAFIAGISLADFPYTVEINSKAKVLRDFFITIFFTGLGAGLIFSSLGDLIIPLIVLSLFVLIGNPLIVLILMAFMGYDKRTSFFVGLTIANISEFSLIVVALGNKLGHLDDTITSMTTIIAIGTMVMSTYMITYNDWLYKNLKRYLSVFEIKQRLREDLKIKKKGKFSNHVIMVGCGQIGQEILDQVTTFKEQYVVVDHDNLVIKKLMEKDISCIFGDIEDEEVYEFLDLEDAEIIISTIPNHEDNYFLLNRLKEIKGNKKPIVLMVATSAREGLDLFIRGADYVILKPYLSAEHIHSINRELYRLEEDITLKQKNGKKRKITEMSELESDSDLAKLLHNLNKMRLKEIKTKIEDKKILVLKNKILKVDRKPPTQ